MAGELTFLAVGKLLGRSRDDLVQVGSTHVANQPNDNVVARYFSPGQNRIYVIFKSVTNGDMMQVLYRTPGIAWEDVLPITNLQDAVEAAGDMQGSCNN